MPLPLLYVEEALLLRNCPLFLFMPAVAVRRGVTNRTSMFSVRPQHGACTVLKARSRTKRCSLTETALAQPARRHRLGDDFSSSEPLTNESPNKGCAHPDAIFRIDLTVTD